MEIAGKTLTFDVTKHVMTIGLLKVNDYGEDSAIKMSFSELMSITQGVNGTSCFNKKPTMSGTFEVNVLQNSPMAVLLRKMAMAQIPYPVTYGNLELGGSGWFAPEAVFEKVPDETIKQDAGTITFKLIAPNVENMK